MTFWSSGFRFAGSISHHVGHGAGVSHGLHAKDLLGPVALVALGKLATWLILTPVAGREAQMTKTYHPPRTSPQQWWVQAFPDMFCIGPLHHTRGHSDGAVMCGVVGVQQGQQYVHKTPRPVGRHVAMNHALQWPLEAFHHGACEMYVPGHEQLLEGHRAHLCALVAMHGQWWLVSHIVQNGLHGSRRLGASLAGKRSCAGVLGEYVYATEKLPGAVVGLSVLTAVHQVALQLFPQHGHGGLLLAEAERMGRCSV